MTTGCRDVFKGFMHARLDRWGSFFTTKIHVGTPASLAESGASLSFVRRFFLKNNERACATRRTRRKADVQVSAISVHSDPCNRQTMSFEISAQVALYGHGPM